MDIYLINEVMIYRFVHHFCCLCVAVHSSHVSSGAPTTGSCVPPAHNAAAEAGDDQQHRDPKPARRIPQSINLLLWHPALSFTQTRCI